MNIEDIQLTEQSVAEYIHTLYLVSRKPSARKVIELLDRVAVIPDEREKLSLLFTIKQSLSRDLKPLAIASLRAAEKHWAEKA